MTGFILASKTLKGFDGSRFSGSGAAPVRTIGLNVQQPTSNVQIFEPMDLSKPEVLLGAPVEQAEKRETTN
jgi:hypothetical protein